MSVLQYMNPCPGLVVSDDAVRSQATWDFYMCSHAPIQGTSRPVHYAVLLDGSFLNQCAPNTSMTGPEVLLKYSMSFCVSTGAEIGLTQAGVEMLLYNSCHKNSRCSRACSIPAPSCTRAARMVATSRVERSLF